MKSLIPICIILILGSSLCSFQTSFLKEMNKAYKEKNLIISPISVYQILSLTANGAKGETLKQMLKALSSDELLDLNKINLGILKAVKQFTSIEIANAVFTNFKPINKFTNMAYTYEATIQGLRDAAQINDWCDAKTHGKIKKIIDSIEPNTMMILLNAVYFKGVWKKEFDPKNTKKKAFYNLGDKNNEALVDMMNIQEAFKYYEDSTVQIIEIPFTKDSASAIIMLPNVGIDINTFISELDDQKLQKYLSYLFPEKVDLTLPKFELEFESQLTDALQNLGMKDAFGGDADLSGMKRERDIYISKVIQKTYLKVDENGAEAAAATAVIIKTKSISREKRMVINRPFLMFLKSSALPENTDILFAAKIEKF